MISRLCKCLKIGRCNWRWSKRGQIPLHFGHPKLTAIKLIRILTGQLVSYCSLIASILQFSHPIAPPRSTPPNRGQTNRAFVCYVMLLFVQASLKASLVRPGSSRKGTSRYPCGPKQRMRHGVDRGQSVPRTGAQGNPAHDKGSNRNGPIEMPTWF